MRSLQGQTEKNNAKSRQTDSQTGSTRYGVSQSVLCPFPLEEGDIKMNISSVVCTEPWCSWYNILAQAGCLESVLTD